MKKYKRWTKQEIDFIVENYSKIKDQELAKLLCKDDRPVTVDMIRRQRRNLKIRKKRGRPCQDQKEAEINVSESEKCCSMENKRDN